jgi:hypothetical protein
MYNFVAETVAMTVGIEDARGKEILVQPVQQYEISKRKVVVQTCSVIGQLQLPAGKEYSPRHWSLLDDDGQGDA